MDKNLAQTFLTFGSEKVVCPAPDLTLKQAIKQFEERFKLGLSGQHFVTATASQTLPGQMVPYTYSFYYDPANNLYEMDRTVTSYNFEEKRLSKDTERYQITVQGQIIAAWRYSESPRPDMTGFVKTPPQPVTDCADARRTVHSTLKDICSADNDTAQIHTFLY